jgi:hypothetical protein
MNLRYSYTGSLASQALIFLVYYLRIDND